MAVHGQNEIDQDIIRIFKNLGNFTVTVVYDLDYFTRT